MKIRFLGAHNTESQETKLVSLLIDDRLALDAGGLTSSLSFDKQLKLRAILLTHQHYDHIKDIPLLGMNLFLEKASIDVFSTSSVYESLVVHLLNDLLYPAFMKEAKEGATIRFHTINLYQEVRIGDYFILPLPVDHSVPAVGYQITSTDGKAVFYTGDTGLGLADCWRYITPNLIIIEVTASDRFEQFGIQKGHLTPSLLKQEMLDLLKIKGYLPDVITVHMNPALESEIEAELSTVAAELGNSITLAYEGMEIEL
ncbi:MAG: lactamase [Dehalococcoidia bacterium]|nr:MAG: lactamase [Dehalococcoidia bacterium]